MSRAGIPNFEPTEDQRKLVRQVAGIGVPHEMIRLLVKNGAGEPISADTLKRHFAADLEEGKANTAAQMVGKLVATALGQVSAQQTACLIFWCKTQLGWRETSALDVNLPPEEEGDALDKAARVAGLIERGRRRARGADVTEH